MKSLQQMIGKIKSDGITPSIENQYQAPDGAKDFIDKLFDELKATFPAWAASMKTDQAVDNAKRVWTKAFMENGINQVAQVKIGLVHARKDARPFFPSVGEFIEWCNGAIDIDAAFYRFINREDALNDVEARTRTECGYACRNQLSEVKALARFRNTYLRWQKRKDDGCMPDPDIKALPKHSPNKLSDHMVEERIRSDKPKTPLELRIDALRKKDG